MPLDFLIDFLNRMLLCCKEIQISKSKKEKYLLNLGNGLLIIEYLLLQIHITKINDLIKTK